MLKTNALFCAVAMVLLAGCQTSDPTEDPRLTDEDIETHASNLPPPPPPPDRPKGLGGTNGMSSYCNNPGALCANGEGDCDATSQCQAGLACIPNQGPKFGLGASVDVCMPATCVNRRLDPGEIVADCGGPCPSCTQIIGAKGSMTAMPGSPNYCIDPNNLCTVGEGGCRTNAQCQFSTCTPGVGAKFGFPAGTNVCLPDTCSNRVRDPNEASVDCGGGSACGPCAIGAPTCYDGVRNGHETGVDCGGFCVECVKCTNAAGIRNGNFLTDTSDWSYVASTAYNAGMGNNDTGYVTSTAANPIPMISQTAVCLGHGVNAVSFYGASYSRLSWVVGTLGLENRAFGYNGSTSYAQGTICLGELPQFDFYFSAQPQESRAGIQQSSFDNFALINSANCPVPGQVLNNSFDLSDAHWMSQGFTFPSGEASFTYSDGNSTGNLLGWVSVPLHAQLPGVVIHFSGDLHADELSLQMGVGQSSQSVRVGDIDAIFCLDTTTANGHALPISVDVQVSGLVANIGGTLHVTDVAYVDDATCL